VRRVYCGLLAVLVVGAFLVQMVGAAEVVRIYIEPGTMRLTLQPGEEMENTFTVRNRGGEAYTFRLYAEPFFVNEEYENVFGEENNFTQIWRWVSFPQESYYLEPGEVVEVPYVVSVPEDAGGGGQYCVIFAEVEERKGRVGVANRVGTLVYTTIDGKAVRAGRTEFEQVGFWQTGSSVTFHETAVNEGDVDYSVATDIIVRHWLTGKEVERSTKKTTEKMVMPGTSRKIEYVLSDLGVGLYSVRREAVVFGETFWTEQVILVLPLIYVVFAGVAVVAFGAFMLRRRIHRKRVVKGMRKIK